ncbi:MAG TPA: DinB family protein, partial [Methyloversatilis sp.]
MNAHQDTLFLRSPRLDTRDAGAMRASLRDYFHATFSRYEQLFEVLTCDEAYYRKPIALRHPLIFYLGHTATFFINKMLLAGLIAERIDPRLESMFAVGVDEMSWDDLNEAHYDWPTVAEVRAYRNAVRQTVDRVIHEAPLDTPIGWDNPWWVVIMGIEHERSSTSCFSRASASFSSSPRCCASSLLARSLAACRMRATSSSISCALCSL